jgi:hypothetical protein
MNNAKKFCTIQARHIITFKPKQSIGVSKKFLNFFSIASSQNLKKKSPVIENK